MDPVKPISGPFLVFWPSFMQTSDVFEPVIALPCQFLQSTAHLSLYYYLLLVFFKALKSGDNST